MIATTVTASAARDVTVSRHQLSALERRQMSEVTTPYALTASAETRAPYRRAAKRHGRFARTIPSNKRM